MATEVFFSLLLNIGGNRLRGEDRLASLIPLPTTAQQPVSDSVRLRPGKTSTNSQDAQSSSREAPSVCVAALKGACRVRHSDET